jgi:rod shape determining protein RodA
VRGLGQLGGRTAVGVGRWRGFVARFDWPLFLTIALLVLIGMLNLYSATYRTQHRAKFDQQITWLAIGLGGFFVVTLLDYRNLLRMVWLLLLVALVATLAVFLIGQTHKGAQRWLGFSAVRVQPSELVKITVILAMARLIHEREVEQVPIGQLALQWGAIVAPVFLVAVQPDLGSGILIALIILSVGFLALPSVWPMVAAFLTALAALPILWDHMHPYQKNRVLAFLDPNNDRTGDGWHTLQSIYAVGSGKLTGKGFMEGTQNQFSFLPEQWTDFPFSVWAEEWGFVGALVVLALYGFLVFWIINVALAARDKFGSALCVGVAAMVFWHFLVNIAMVLGMAPVVGMTLPLVSYGGSSLVTFFLALGLVSSVSMRRHGF